MFNTVFIFLFLFTSIFAEVFSFDQKFDLSSRDQTNHVLYVKSNQIWQNRNQETSQNLESYQSSLFSGYLLQNPQVEFNFKRGIKLHAHSHPINLLENTIYQLEEQIFDYALGYTDDIALLKQSFGISLAEFDEEFRPLGLSPVCKFNPVMSRLSIHGIDWLRVEMETYVMHFNFDKNTDHSMRYALETKKVMLYFCVFQNHLYQAHFSTCEEIFNDFKFIFELSMYEFIECDV